MKKKEGFALVEMIVVLAIIAILAGGALPVYNSIVSKAERNVCISQMSQMHMLLRQYQIDNPDATMEEALAGSYEELNENFSLFECPCGGTYEIDANGHISCSVHGSLDELLIEENRAREVVETSSP